MRLPAARLLDLGPMEIPKSSYACCSFQNRWKDCFKRSTKPTFF
jgi:hypothetical protein